MFAVGFFANGRQTEVVHSRGNYTTIISNSMNEYELTKVRRQLQQSQEVTEELRGDLKFTEERLVRITVERDNYHSEILITR